ncbi:hypothetical protein EEL30_21735 [Brevibacillus laterosporus]|uniref:YopX protein domain-containing protein n=1 Tax=Brevibacillus laterosporus TaxID=1465 RepID=A0A518VCF2_BRELA|nr:hypothetical protein EEL30_21735 [Brevibacillus laterosporus]
MFLAWDDNRQKWITKDVIITNDGIYKDFRDYLDGIATKEVAILKNVGIPDKNNKQVYEEYIVHHEFYGQLIVKWLTEQAYFYLHDPHYSDPYEEGEHHTAELIRECEVIGNTFEDIY